MDITYQSLPGYRPLKLDLYRSTSTKPNRPIVIFVHGGRWLAGSPRMSSPVFGDMDKVLARLAKRGYVVAGVSYRLSAEAHFPAAVDDVQAAIRWLRANSSKFGSDPARVALWGESAGAYIAIMAALSCRLDSRENATGHPLGSSCVQSVVDWYGPTDFGSLDAQALAGSRIKHDAADSPESTFLGCALSECAPALLRQAAALGYVTSHAPPFLIMHGEADTAISPEQSRSLYAALTSAGASAKLDLVPGVNHGFAGATPKQAQEILSTVFAYLDATLGIKRPETQGSNE